MSLGRYLPAPVKRNLRALHSRARKAVVQRFYSFSPADLLGALRKLGIQPGDTVMAHTAYARFEGFTGTGKDAVEVLKQAVSPAGNLMLPTLPFSGSMLEYARSGKITDILRTPSQMGMLTELFRRMPDVARSIHPTHPVAIWGARAAELAAGHHQARTPCGVGSPFHHLLEANGKILLAGVDIRVLTFFHYAEEVLEPTMPFSPFLDEWFDLSTRADGQVYTTRTKVYNPAVSVRRNLPVLEQELRQAGRWRETKVGLLNLTVISAGDTWQALQDLARRGTFCYLPAGRQH